MGEKYPYDGCLLFSKKNKKLAFSRKLNLLFLCSLFCDLEDCPEIVKCRGELIFFKGDNFVKIIFVSLLPRGLH